MYIVHICCRYTLFGSLDLICSDIYQYVSTWQSQEPTNLRWQLRFERFSFLNALLFYAFNDKIMKSVRFLITQSYTARGTAVKRTLEAFANVLVSSVNLTNSISVLIKKTL